VPVLIAVDQWNAFHAEGKILVERGEGKENDDIRKYDPMDSEDSNADINRIARIFSDFSSFTMVRLQWGGLRRVIFLKPLLKQAWGMFVVAVSSSFPVAAVMHDGFGSHKTSPEVWKPEELQDLRAKILHSGTCLRRVRFLCVQSL
jgi:hypothetical protein